MIKKFFVIVMFFCAIGLKAQDIKFKADIRQMIPMSYSPQPGLSGFSFEMRNDSAFVYLAYIGRVDNPTFGNDGLNFDAPCEEMKVKPTKKKNGRKLDFKVKHDIVTYRFQVTLWDNNSIDIMMQPSNAQSCSYSGEWE